MSVEAGGSNDIRKNIQIKEPTTIVVKKDKFDCGKVFLLLHHGKPEYAAQKISAAPSMEYLIIKANQTTRVVRNGEYMKVIRGDLLRMTDVITNLPDQNAVVVNFKGFVGNKQNNTGEDRGLILQKNY
jgi:hypothetical protein